MAFFLTRVKPTWLIGSKTYNLQECCDVRVTVLAFNGIIFNNKKILKNWWSISIKFAKVIIQLNPALQIHTYNSLPYVFSADEMVTRFPKYVSVTLEVYFCWVVGFCFIIVIL